MDQGSPKIIDKKMIFLLTTIGLIEVWMAVYGPSESLDMKYYYTGDDARALFQSFTAADVRTYFINEIFDLILLASYSFAFFLGLQRLYSPRLWTIALPLVAGVSDLIETLVIMSVLKFSNPVSFFDWLGILTCLKWTLIVIMLFLAGVGLVLRRLSSAKTAKVRSPT